MTDRRSLETVYGAVWDEKELTQQFTVMAIIAPRMVVRRKSDGQVGIVTFQNRPRFFFNYQRANSE